MFQNQTFILASHPAGFIPGSPFPIPDNQTKRHGEEKEKYGAQNERYSAQKNKLSAAKEFLPLAQK